MSSKKDSINASCDPPSQNVIKNEDDADNDCQLHLASASTSSREKVTETKSTIDENNIDSKEEVETSRKVFPEDSMQDTVKDVVAPAAIDIVERNIEEYRNYNDNNNDNGTCDADDYIPPENLMHSSNESQISHFDTVSSVTKDSALVFNMTPFSYYDDDDDDVSSMTESFNPELAAESHKILQLSRSNTSG